FPAWRFPIHKKPGVGVGPSRHHPTSTISPLEGYRDGRKRTNSMSQRLSGILVSLLAVLMIATPVQQLLAAPATAPVTVALTYSVGESLTISATPGSITWSGAGQSGPISIVTSWNLGGGGAAVGETTLQTDAWFATAVALQGPMSISTSQLTGTVAAGSGVVAGASGPFTQSVSFA